MAQPHSQIQAHGYPPQHGRPQQFSPQSPTGPMQYNSPSPQTQFSPSFSPQAPPAKRPRLSPDVPSIPGQAMASPAAGSPPPVSLMANGAPPSQASRMNSMPPPQRPAEKDDQNYDDIFKGTGIDLDREASFSTGFFSAQSNQNYMPPGQNGAAQQGPTNSPNVNGAQISQEERRRRAEQRQDWEAARHSQHELWDPFLYGGTLNERLKLHSNKANLSDPQSGVLVNTQKNAPPPTVRVNGLEGASRVISNGQSILDTKEKAERLSELVKLLSLAAKARLTGLVQASARMSIERREHSRGRIPDDWSDLAVRPRNADTSDENATSPASAGMKRSFSQANGDGENNERPHVDANLLRLQQLAEASEKADEQRRKRREKRNAKLSAVESEQQATADAEAIAAMEDKKTTKKERKIAESKISEQQQTANTNDATRLATANLFGRFGGGKKKTYSWLQGGGTPSRPPSAVGTPTRNAATPTPAAQQAREKPERPERRLPYGHYDESRDPGIQARDLLLVLETDGRCAQAFVRGTSFLDDQKPSGI